MLSTKHAFFTVPSTIFDSVTAHEMTASSYSELLSGLSYLGYIVITAFGVYMIYWLYILNRRSIARNLKLDMVASTRFTNTQYRNIKMNIENTGRKTAKNIRIKLYKINFEEDGKVDSTIENVSEKDYLRSGESFSAEIFDMNDNELKLAGESHKRQSVSFDVFITGDNFSPINKSIRYYDKTDLFRGEVFINNMEDPLQLYKVGSLIQH